MCAYVLEEREREREREKVMSFMDSSYRWEEAIKRAMMGTQDLLSPELPSSPIGEEFHNRPSLAHLNPRGEECIQFSVAWSKRVVCW